MLCGFTGESMIKRAIDSQIAEVRTIDLRDFAGDAHRTTDSRPYGGGPGMIMRPEPIFDAVESVRTEESSVILMTPQGRRFDQTCARRLALQTHLVLVCGHYEGVDERVRSDLVDEEISVGDFVLTNGVLAAAVVMDAVIRLLPGALGADDATEIESFSDERLEYPQYTRPATYRDAKVPEVLLSGDHAAIARWREEQALKRTEERRPDLLERQRETEQEETGNDQ
jgi:tRNA (guanine37-N1)-methyltransferase